MNVLRKANEEILKSLASEQLVITERGNNVPGKHTFEHKISNDMNKRELILTTKTLSFSNLVPQLDTSTPTTDDSIYDRIVEPLIWRSSLALYQTSITTDTDVSEEINTHVQESSSRPFQILRRLSIAATRGILYLMNGKSEDSVEKKEFNEKIDEILEDKEEFRRLQEFLRMKGTATNAAAKQLIPIYSQSYTLKAGRIKDKTAQADIIVDPDPDKGSKRCHTEKNRCKDINYKTKFSITA